MAIMRTARTSSSATRTAAPQGFGAEAKRRIMLGAWLLASGVYDEYYIPAQKVRTLITADYTKAFEKVDAIVLPTSPRTAFKFGEVSDPASMYLSDIYTISINIAGNGGMSLPVAPGRGLQAPHRPADRRPAIP